ncbi:MAG: GvpL/GvpF family gas vesicle protein [Pirellulales bacterium]
MTHQAPLQLLGIARSKDVTAASFLGGDERSLYARRRPSEADLTSGEASWVLQDALAAAVAAPLPPLDGPLTHARLLEAIHRRFGILPARFGMVLPGQRAVRVWLYQHCDRLLDDLTRLRGTSEMGLRIEMADGTSRPNSRVTCAEPTAPTSGLSYLASRRDRFAQRDGMENRSRLAIDRCLQQIEGCFRDWRRLTSAQPSVIRLAFLVDCDCVERFRGRLQSAGVTKCEQRRALVGPWPPYSFV